MPRRAGVSTSSTCWSAHQGRRAATRRSRPARVSTHTAVVVGPHQVDAATCERAAGSQPPAVAGARPGHPVERQRREEHPPRAIDTDDATDRHRRRAARHAAVGFAVVARCRAAAGGRTGGRHPRPRSATPWLPVPSRKWSSRSTWAAPAGSPPIRRRSRPAPVRPGCSSCWNGRSRSSRWCTTSSTRARPCASGRRTRIDELRDCSIVVAPYRVDGEVAGTVGVLGPTRMDYRQALAAVEAISQQLGDVLS